MRKAVVVLGALLIALPLVSGGLITYALFNQADPADLSERINVYVNRSADWERIVDTAVLTKEEMLTVDGSTATIPITMELYRQFYGFSDDKVYDAWRHADISHGTTPVAYRHLIENETRPGSGTVPVSLILVTPPSFAEEQRAEEAGVQLDLTPVAKDGFIFITHKNNPVDSLTVDQIRGIYSGEITNWSEVGGEDRDIVAYQREKGSGSQTAMDEMVMAGETFMDPPVTQMAWGMGAMVDAVAEFQNGPASIGYTYAYYLNNLYLSDDIKVLEVEGIAATDQTIADGSYPFATNYYAVIRSDEPENSPARRLLDFLVSPLGQEVVAMAGYVTVAE